MRLVAYLDEERPLGYIYRVCPENEKPPEGPPSEPVTEPDLAVFDCPNCKDERGVSQGEIVERAYFGTQHRMRIVVCKTCGGRKLVDREGMARWQHEQKQLK